MVERTFYADIMHATTLDGKVFFGLEIIIAVLRSHDIIFKVRDVEPSTYLKEIVVVKVQSVFNLF